MRYTVPNSASRRYDRVAHETARGVIRRYSTSFGLASRLLRPDVRAHIEDVYALVRLADEIVDGVPAEAGVDPDAITAYLDALEQETESALARGYSTNLIVHAFALSAREVGFGVELTRPFFASMRMDVSRAEHTEQSFRDYVYGSAEVVGLMCLCSFLNGRSVAPAERARLETGARHLGAAFQKVNFLRDLSADFMLLGRSYFPGVNVGTFTESEKCRLLDDIDRDLAAAAATVDLLPADARRAVALAHRLFGELARRLRATPSPLLVESRVRVPNPVKLRLALLTVTGSSLAAPRARAARR